MHAKTNLKSRLPSRCAADGVAAPIRAASTAGEAIVVTVRNVHFRDPATRTALENAATTMAASGGSADAALNLPAMANECGIAFTLFDVAEVFKKTPNIADLKPGGRYVAKDLVEVGGVPPLTHPGGKAEKISYADQ